MTEMTIAHCRIAAVAGLLAGAAIVGCGNGSSPSAATVACPVSTLSPARPVTVSLWESYDAVEDQAFRSLADTFNRTHPAVHVNIEHDAPTGSDPTGYQENGAVLRRFFGDVLDGGPLPDLVESAQEPATRLLIDSGGIVPAQVCIDATHADLSDFLPQTLAETHVGSTQWGMPDGYDGVVGFYNTPTLLRAGLDPSHLPETLAEMLAWGRTLAAHGVPDPITNLNGAALTLSGVRVTDENDGRDDRPTRAVFDTPTGREALALISDIGSLRRPNWTGPAAPAQTTYAQLAELAQGDAAYTDTLVGTADLKELVLPALARGQAPNVELAVGPVPSLTGPGGTGTWTTSWFLTKASTPARRAGAWEFLTWFDEPAQQASWHLLTGYFPVRLSAPHDPRVIALWREQPLLGQVWTLVTTRPWAVSPIVAGTVGIGNLPPPTDPDYDAAFSAAVRHADATIVAYDTDPTIAIGCYGLPPSNACPDNGAPPAPP